MSRLACRKSVFLVGLSVLLPAMPVFAQDTPMVREDMWVCSVAETTMYSLSGAAFGGGAALGYGDGVALGLKAVYVRDRDELTTLEMGFLVRFYLPRLTGHSGLFLQFNGGAAIFTEGNDGIAMPAETGTISAGLSLGWRFIFGRTFFLEPAVRGGYPYIAGASVSAGVRF